MVRVLFFFFGADCLSEVQQCQVRPRVGPRSRTHGAAVRHPGCRATAPGVPRDGIRSAAGRPPGRRRTAPSVPRVGTLGAAGRPPSVASTQFDESHAGVGPGGNGICGLGNTIRDAMYFSYIIQESGRSFQFPFTLHVDPQVSTVFANTGAVRKLLHHIDQRQCWVAACRDSRVCVVKKVHTTGNFSDIGSKGFISRPKEFIRQRDRLQSCAPYFVI